MMLSVWLGLVLLLPQQGTIYGWVRAEGSREPVPFAAVEVVGERSAMADEHGYYVVPGVSAGEHEVRASMLGYETVTRAIVVPADGRARADFLLPTRPVRLDAIRVRGEAGETDALATPGPPPMRIDAPTLDLVPGLAEKDVFRAIQMLPSVAAASDFSSALYIRGGAPDQTLVLLDGAPLFNPYHLGGMFSAIDPDAVSTVEILPGGMPATDGDRASGVVKVWTRDGGRDRVRGHGALGLVSSRLGIDGPLWTGSGSYLVSARRTYFDLMTKGAYELGIIDTPFPYSFTDAHAKITQDIGRTGRLNISGYINDERVHTPREADPYNRTSFAWGTRAGSVSYRQPFSASLLADVTLAGTSFDGDFDLFEVYGTNPDDARPITVDTTLLGRMTMRDLLADASLTWYGAGHELKVGAQVDVYDFDYFVQVEDRVVTDPVLEDDGSDDFEDIFAALGEAAGVTTVAGYVEDEWTVSEDFAFRVGIRALHAGGLGTEVMPRLGLRLGLSDRLSLTAGAGRYAQAIHSLRDEESVFASIIPYELLVPASAETGFLISEDVALGLEYRRPNTRIRLDGYYKRYPTLPTPPPASDPLNAPIFSDEFLVGSGEGLGLELFAQQGWGRSLLMASYALTWVERELDGATYPPRYHRLHLADITGGLQFGDGGLLTARLTAGTGQPYTRPEQVLSGFTRDPVTGRYLPDRPRIVLGEHNGERLPGYLRLDVGVRNESSHRWFGREVFVTPYFQVLNLLGNRNVTGGQPDFRYGDDGAPAEVEYLPALPVIPTFGVEWRF